ncbi:MAG: MATE family efflux transporter [Deltaproteobacteria bacterium]|nr:MATE family efflux transporter [Deltaproteobacteria bacterium]
MEKRWDSPHGYKAFLKLCLPLIAATMASSVMLFTDRLFLSHYSFEAIAAALPAGVIKLTITAVFLGIASYTGVFAAQYTGADQPQRAAAVLWQGLYFSLFFGLILSGFYYLSPVIFELTGHEPAVAKLEDQYFRILVLGQIPELLMVTMSCFLSSLGRTKEVMWVSVGGAVLNIPLDYLLIFGLNVGGQEIIPELGVRGAALATSVSWLASAVALSFFIFSSKMEKSHQVRSCRSFELPLFKRLLKFGWPGGLQFFMEIFAYTFFAAAVGRLDSMTLATNNIVFSLEGMSFLPMLGAGQAVSILVGQAVGRGTPQDGAEITKSGLVVTTLYALLMTTTFILFPDQLLSIFLEPTTDPAEQIFIMQMGRVLLMFVAAYCIFDGFYLCSFGAIRGAGDVWFPMLAMGFWGLFGLVAPIMLLLILDLGDIYYFWVIMVSYVLGLTGTGVWRYRSRIWMTKSVIGPPEIAA